ncbi:MAG: hypothetical protein JW793_14480 [Acidobacteria bacterium]|nr:hypothetical protein [Acidobacteriota bacterium]
MGDLCLILVSGRCTKQGEGISAGKGSPEYREATGAVSMNPSDMRRAGLRDGDSVMLHSEFGEVSARCLAGDMPEGLAFMPFGSACNRLVGGETCASGMPDSKHFRVELKLTAEERSPQRPAENE